MTLVTTATDSQAPSIARKPRVCSLFAGIGGICRAFSDAGCDVIWANELDEKACMTYELNNPNTHLVHDDICTIRAEDIPDCDILVGGFPCQPFSQAGERLGLQDPRGKLFFEITRIIKEKGDSAPEALLFENVSHLLNHDGGRTYAVMTRKLSDLGYHVTERVMNSKDYSYVPQNRNRLYIVAFKDERCFSAFSFPDRVTERRSINEIVDRSVKAPDKYYYNEKKAKYFSMYVQEVTDSESIYQFRRVYIRKNKSHLCPALTASMGRGGHNVPIIIDDFGIRKLTPEECLKFQGFEDFQFPDIGDCYKYTQAGNSVTIPVVRRIAENIVSVLQSSNLFVSDHEYVRNNDPHVCSE